MEEGQIKIVDLYSGAGGFTHGFARTFDAVHWAVEMWSTAAETWEANFGEGMRMGRVGDMLQWLPEQADIVIGGPPCQGFSKMNQHNKGIDKANDPRNSEWKQYLKVVERCRPTAFVMENVLQIDSSGTYNQIVDEANGLGYSAVGRIMCAADYGAPTIRKRFIIVGLRGGGIWKAPAPTHIDPDKRSDDLFADPRPSWRTVRDAIEDLADPPTEDPLHVDRSTDADKRRWAALPPDVEHPPLRWFQAHRPDLIPPSKRVEVKDKTWMDSYSWMEWDRPSPTITCAHPGSQQGRSGHPSRTRQVTIRECARLQSFPDDFKFTGRLTEVAKQIGNAVPPKLAEAIAASLKGEFSR